MYSALASIQFNLSESHRRFASAAGSQAARGLAERTAEWGGGDSLFQVALDDPAPRDASSQSRQHGDGAALHGSNGNHQPGIAWLDPAGVTIERCDQGLLRVTGAGRPSSP